MSVTHPISLEEAIRHSGEDWLIEWFEPPSQAISSLSNRLDAINDLAKHMCGEDVLDLSEAGLLKEYVRNPLRVKGFFQALGTLRMPEILLLSWRIIQGLDVKSLQIQYDRLTSFSMNVILEALGGADESYQSNDINDLKILRHIGILQFSDNPMLEGFYPLNLRK